MIKVLRDQLILEGKDKQFLLKRAIQMNEHLVKNGLKMDILDLVDDPRKNYNDYLNTESTSGSGRSTSGSGRSSKTDSVEMDELPGESKKNKFARMESVDYFHQNHYHEHKFD